MSSFYWLKVVINRPFTKLVNWDAMKYTSAFWRAKSSLLASRWVVDRSVCIGKYCGYNKYYIQGTPGKTIATRCTKTASQKTTTRADANCQHKHWWCRASNIPGVFQLGCFQVSMASVESFLLNLGSTYVIELINMYKVRNEAYS